MRNAESPMECGSKFSMPPPGSAAAKARGVVIGGMRDKSRELQAEARERIRLRGIQ
jgi:hypothetical protein